MINDLGLPEWLMQKLTPLEEHVVPDGALSVTQILAPTRQMALQLLTSPQKAVSELQPILVGTAIHRFLESPGDHPALLVTMPDGGLLSGLVDYYDESTGLLAEFKTTSRWIAGPEVAWEQQIQVYAWMLGRMGKPVNSLQVVVFRTAWAKMPLVQLFDVAYDREYTEGYVYEKYQALREALRDPEKIPVSCYGNCPTCGVKNVCQTMSLNIVDVEL